MDRDDIYKKTTSLKDVAREAKCSIATVSRYFNGDFVSDEIKKRIKECCDKLNFIPNQNAKSLRKKDNVIFVISQTTIQPRTEIIIQEINKMFFDKYFIYTTHANHDITYFKKTIMNVISRNPENVIIFLAFENIELIEFINSIKNFSFIVITPSELIANHHKRIKINDYDAFYELTKLMIEKDKKNKIAFINRLAIEQNHEMKVFSHRTKGFKDCVSNYKNIKYEIALIQNNIDEAQKTIYELYKKGYRDFICGTHTIFRACINDKRIINCNFTDYGGKSVSDKPCRYSYKLFLDYSMIAKEIVNTINSKNNKNDLIFTPIITKKEN